jgi:hypothetical protein
MKKVWPARKAGGARRVTAVEAAAISTSHSLRDTA